MCLNGWKDRRVGDPFLSAHLRGWQIGAGCQLEFSKAQGSGSQAWSLSMWACQCGLGFLTAWWLGSQGEHSERERETRGRYIAFMIWPQSPIVSLLLNSLSQGCHKSHQVSKGRGRRFYPWWGIARFSKSVWNKNHKLPELCCLLKALNLFQKGEKERD